MVFVRVDDEVDDAGPSDKCSAAANEEILLVENVQDFVLELFHQEVFPLFQQPQNELAGGLHHPPTPILLLDQPQHPHSHLLHPPYHHHLILTPTQRRQYRVAYPTRHGQAQKSHHFGTVLGRHLLN